MATRAVHAAVAALMVALSCGTALATDDEVTDLRVRKGGGAGAVTLSWTPPITPADSSQVRRCALATVNDSAGVCIVEGLTATTYVDVPPAGNHFYLVSGLFRGREGSLGEAWDGTALVPRIAPACSSPPNPGPLSLLVTMDAPFDTCGSDLRLRFDSGAVTWTAAPCVGIESTFLPFAGINPARPEIVFATCSGFTPSPGPGLVRRFDFGVGECPVGIEDFQLVKCQFFDCQGFAFVLPCTVTVQ